MAPIASTTWAPSTRTACSGPHLFLLALPAVSDGWAGVEPARRARVAGTYRLYRVNGRARPLRVDDTHHGATVVVSGSVVLRPDGSYTARLSMRATPQASGPAQEYPVIDHGTYVLRRNRLSIAAEDHRQGLLGFLEKDVERVTIEHGEPPASRCAPSATVAGLSRVSPGRQVMTDSSMLSVQ